MESFLGGNRDISRRVYASGESETVEAKGTQRFCELIACVRQTLEHEDAAQGQACAAIAQFFMVCCERNGLKVLDSVEMRGGKSHVLELAVRDKKSVYA